MIQEQKRKDELKKKLKTFLALLKITPEFNKIEYKETDTVGQPWLNGILKCKKEREYFVKGRIKTKKMKMRIQARNQSGEGLPCSL